MHIKYVLINNNLNLCHRCKLVKKSWFNYRFLTVFEKSSMNDQILAHIDSEWLKTSR